MTLMDLIESIAWGCVFLWLLMLTVNCAIWLFAKLHPDPVVPMVRPAPKPQRTYEEQLRVWCNDFDVEMVKAAHPERFETGPQPVDAQTETNLRRILGAERLAAIKARYGNGRV